MGYYRDMENIGIIYKDSNFLVINKPAGLVMHQAKVAGNRRVSEEKTLADWLLENYPEVRTVGDDPMTRPGIVHRLDKETSGVLVVALNQKTFEYLKSLFQKHLVQKKYVALVDGKIKEKQGTINKPIGIRTGSVKRSVKSSRMLKEAITEYKLLRYVKLKDRDFSLLEITPKTGRTHQIRVHLASIGHPVIGDKLYGGARSELKGVTRQFLHAESIEFTAPDGERMKFEAELPAELRIYLNNNSYIE